MSVPAQKPFDRERTALYIAGLLPDDTKEADAVMALIRKLQETVRKDRDQRRDG